MITRSLLAFAMLAGPAFAEEAASDAKALSWSASSRLDVIGPVAGLDQGKRGYLVEESSLIGDLDLERAIGWRGGSLHGWLRNTSGGAPNDAAGASSSGSLQASPPAGSTPTARSRYRPIAIPAARARCAAAASCSSASHCRYW
jgi:hypothetical protein